MTREDIFPILTIVIVAVVMFFICGLIKRVLELLIDIRNLSLGKRMCEEPNLSNLVDLANGYWRLQKTIERISDSLESDNKKRLENSVRAIQNYLSKNDIQIEDYTGRTANDGMNIDITNVEYEDVKKPYIYQTMCPAIFYKGSLIKRSQVIVHDKIKNDDKE